MNQYQDELEEHLNITWISFEIEAMKETTLKNVHIYCVINNVSAQKFGAIIEKYIIKNYRYIKNNSSDCNGDCNKNNINFEIKTSLGGSKHDKFNYVQIRPTQDIGMYIFTAYYLNKNNVCSCGELFIFKITRVEMLTLLLKYGNYAHGTIKKLGKISMKQLTNSNNIEYALRALYSDKCWNEFLRFRINEDEL